MVYIVYNQELLNRINCLYSKGIELENCIIAIRNSVFLIAEQRGLCVKSGNNG